MLLEGFGEKKYMVAIDKYKHVVSISLGSSKRDASAVIQLDNCKFIVERRGTDGDMGKARQLLEYWDGKADAIGLDEPSGTSRVCKHCRSR